MTKKEKLMSNLLSIFVDNTTDLKKKDFSDITDLYSTKLPEDSDLMKFIRKQLDEDNDSVALDTFQICNQENIDKFLLQIDQVLSIN